MSHNQILVRMADSGDDVLVRRIAELDSRPPVAGASLIAEIDGVAAAVYSLDEDRVIANPFQHTAAAVELLEARARTLRGTPRRAAGLRAAATTPATAR